MSQLRRFLCPRLPTDKSPIELDQDEAHHALKVLRLGDGATVYATDGLGQGVMSVLNIIRKGDSTRVYLRADGKTDVEAPGAILPIRLEVSILKGDAMDWVIEKAVELGVQSLAPLHCDFTVVQIQKKGADKFQERWQTIADQSLKQCERLTRLKVLPPQPIREYFSKPVQGTTFWLKERSPDAKPLEKLLQKTAAPTGLLVGPEGGFSPDEIAMLSRTPGVVAASLGPLVLRAETAAIASTSVAASILRTDL